VARFCAYFYTGVYAYRYAAFTQLWMYNTFDIVLLLIKKVCYFESIFCLRFVVNMLSQTCQYLSY